MAFGVHGKPLALGIVHIEPLEHILGIFGLRDESPFMQLLDLKTEKELQLAHHRHLEPIGHKL
jgi:hypothetical protein